MMISSRAQDLLAVLRRVGKNNPKRTEVQKHVNMFFDSLDGTTERQADWELDLLQDSVLRMMTEARKE